ncbi:hypothetical protein D3C85_1636700 [compost metagenome]
MVFFAMSTAERSHVTRSSRRWRLSSAKRMERFSQGGVALAARIFCTPSSVWRCRRFLASFFTKVSSALLRSAMPLATAKAKI